MVAGLKFNLEARDYEVIAAFDGETGFKKAFDEKPDLVLLDIMLPILDGWEVCRQIRNKSLVPIIMLTAKSDEESNLKGFRLGVDNYVCKPFSPKVLLAKTKALLKRIDHAADKDDEFYYIDDEFVINPPAHEIMIDKKKCALTTTEFSILLFLVKNQKVALSRDLILDSIWGENYFGDIRIVDTNIKRIREKLGAKAKYIRTIRGVGYKFEVG